MADFAAFNDVVAPLMRKLGGWVSHGMAAMSPVDLMKDAGWRGMRDEGNVWGTLGATVGMSRGGAAQFAAARAANPAIKSYSMGDWFRGRTYNDLTAMAQPGYKASSAMMKAMQNRAMIRGGATAAMVGPMLFGEDTLPGSMTRTARNVGIHATIASSLTPISPLAGAMYAGFAGVNMLRRGDNFGPF